MEATLGIEAARATIIYEISETMRKHGLTIDNRHTALLADVMTFKGTVLAVTRHGIARMKDSVLSLVRARSQLLIWRVRGPLAQASFEMTADHLFEGAIRGATDSIAGVAERIIMGQPIPVGTGMFTVLQATDLPSGKAAPHPRRAPLLGQPRPAS